MALELVEPLRAGPRFSSSRSCARGVQHRVVAPPVDAHLLGLVDRDDEQPDLDGQQLDVEQVHPDVAGDDDALVEHALEDVGQVGRLGRPYCPTDGARRDATWPESDDSVIVSPPLARRGRSGARGGSPQVSVVVDVDLVERQHVGGLRDAAHLERPPRWTCQPSSVRSSPVTPSASLPVSSLSCSARAVLGHWRGRWPRGARSAVGADAGFGWMPQSSRARRSAFLACRRPVVAAASSARPSSPTTAHFVGRAATGLARSSCASARVTACPSWSRSAPP